MNKFGARKLLRLNVDRWGPQKTGNTESWSKLCASFIGSQIKRLHSICYSNEFRDFCSVLIANVCFDCTGERASYTRKLRIFRLFFTRAQLTANVCRGISAREHQSSDTLIDIPEWKLPKHRITTKISLALSTQRLLLNNSTAFAYKTSVLSFPSTESVRCGVCWIILGALVSWTRSGVDGTFAIYFVIHVGMEDWAILLSLIQFIARERERPLNLFIGK